MVSVNTEGYTVDPDRLVVVAYDDRGGTSREVVALTCRYVAATDATGARRIAIEVLHDPSAPAPTNAYFCPLGRVRRELLSPARIRAVRPYRS